MKDKILGTLGISRKAGKLLMGFDRVKEAVLDRKAVLVVITQDISANSKKEIAFVCARQGTDVLETPVTMEEVQSRLGKRCGILALTDHGLADSVKRVATGEKQTSI